MSEKAKQMQRALQAIPSVDRLLGTPPLRRLAERWRREILRNYLQIRLDEYRASLNERESALDRETFLRVLPSRWASDWQALTDQGTRRVINGTGVLLHTNLGRAVLSASARRAVARAARWPVDLELDLDTGKRASRMRKLSVLLRALTGVEDAFAVNNNAAALTLAVDTLARKRRLIVSRGEQVEIGGSFRLPEILERFAGRMVEVGTTNRTRLADYEKAITRRGDVLLKVHRSNFSLQGYVEDTGLGELVELGRRTGCPVVYDLGSGRFDPGMEWLLEPTLEGGLAAGPDLITFSGDKVFGGPQAGVILGAAETVSALRANPLARALRLDKLNLAALIETVAARLATGAELPTRNVLVRDRKEIAGLARALKARLKADGPRGLRMRIVDSQARSGGGAAAESNWPSAAIAIGLTGGSGKRLATRLRAGKPAVLGLLRQDEFSLDLAAVAEEELPELARALLRALAKEEAGS